MKLILSSLFFESLSSLPADQQLVVINICKELTSLDNEQIESYQLPADAPDILTGVVANMQKRVIATRKRRERSRTAVVRTVSAPSSALTANPGSVQSTANRLDPMIAATDYVVNNYENFTVQEKVEITRLILRMLKGINAFSKPVAKSVEKVAETQRAQKSKRKSGNSQKRSLPIQRRQRESKTGKVSIRHFLNKRD